MLILRTAECFTWTTRQVQNYLNHPLWTAVHYLTYFLRHSDVSSSRLSSSKLSGKTAEASLLWSPRESRSPRLRSREASTPLCRHSRPERHRPALPPPGPPGRGPPRPAAAPGRTRPPSARLGSSPLRRWMWCVGTAGRRWTRPLPDAPRRGPGVATGPAGSSRRSCVCTGAPGDTADLR